MNVEFSKKFDKQTQKLRDKRLKNEIKDAIASVIAARIPTDIPNLKKLVGYKNHYRIRIGDYRIGLYIDGQNSEL
jgi:mRNA interferase RelE/StbE